MDIFRVIAERKISEAMEQGEFSCLPGRGKPLVLSDDAWVPADLRIAYRILKNAGHIPPELEIRNEIISLRDLIERLDDDGERMKKLRALNFKIIQLEMMRKRPLGLKNNPAYEYRVMDRMLSS